jgi:hypothetical protein
MTGQINSENDNPFEDFDSTAQILGFIYDQSGADGLNELLATVEATRESLQRHAEDLLEVGLKDVAAIVLEHADNAPSEADLCPYDPDHTANHNSWKIGYQNRLIMRRGFGV